jgi:hypothetical protein
MTNSELTQILDRLQADAANPSDWPRLKAAMRQGLIKIAPADEATITVNGSNNTVAGRDVRITNQNDNRQYIIQGASAEELLKLEARIRREGRYSQLAIMAMLIVGFGLTIALLLQILSPPPPPTPTPTPTLPEKPLKLISFANNGDIGATPYITALAQQDNTLWIGIRTQTGSHRLCKWEFVPIDPTTVSPTLDCVLDTATLPSYAERSDPLGLKGTISDIDIDCRGNLWLTVANIGAVVYSSTETKLTILDRETAAAEPLKQTLSYNTPWGLAVDQTCKEDETVRVWMANNILYAYTYAGRYPDETSPLQAVSSDAFDQVNDVIKNAQALTFDATTERLWFLAQTGDNKFILKALPLKGGEPIHEVMDGVVTTFAVHENTAFYDIRKKIAFIKSKEMFTHPTPLTFAVRQIAIADKWLWVGGDCAQARNCSPLIAFSLDLMNRQEVPLPANYSGTQEFTVTALLVDNQGRTWVGTPRGLLVYSDG